MNLKSFACMLLMLFSCVAYSQPVVIVTPLEVDDRSLSRHSEIARAYIEDALVNGGHASIVERTRLDAMLKEFDLADFSGLVDPSSAAQFGRLAGAQFLVQGSLMDLNTETRSFTGYGVSTQNQVTRASIRVRAFEMETGRIAFSRIYEGSVTMRASSAGGGHTSSDVAGNAIRDALNRLVNDPDFTQVFAQVRGADGTRAKVSIPVSCMADPCDVEVDGLFVGSTPTEISLTENAVVEFSISKAGYETWTRRVQARSGMNISAELEQR